MSESFWNANPRHSLLARLAKLRPMDEPRWGGMTARAMVVHLGDGARMALGTMTVRRARGPAMRVLRLPGVRHLFVHVLPFSRNAPTARELLSTTPGDWSEDVAAFARLSEELAGRAADPSVQWPEHPIFGPLTRRDWGVLSYRHTDHHLRQFGV